MTSRALVDASKFLSYVLRHEPQAIGLMLDREGWVGIEDLITLAAQHDRSIDRKLVEDVVATSDKKRFEVSVDGQRIRAVQGHSTSSVDRQFTALRPPEKLFHGTAHRFLESIRREGLKPGSRHYVHLSADEQTARAVGQRHGSSVVLVVNAGLMHAQGAVFHQAENGVWLTANVPSKFLHEPNDQ